MQRVACIKGKHAYVETTKQNCLSRGSNRAILVKRKPFVSQRFRDYSSCICLTRIIDVSIGNTSIYGQHLIPIRFIDYSKVAEYTSTWNESRYADGSRDGCIISRLEAPKAGSCPRRVTEGAHGCSGMSNGSVTGLMFAASSRASNFSPWLYLICKDSGTKEPPRTVCVASRLASPISSLDLGHVLLPDRQKRESVKWRDYNLTGTYRLPAFLPDSEQSTIYFGVKRY